MDTGKAKRALRNLAKQKGISEREVRREIEIAIEVGMKSPEPQAQSFWKTIPHKGEKPTPEEVITYIADLTKQ
ncbi:hypothetical protein G5B36_13835 [Enterocloster aldensis]|uniref:Sporulation initiation factor Spo0A C-terminal domain-containing protein n=1 Tax=Enterocloster aldenensis TaxID=358742 RepID=A0ABX2HK60_9FIRM|nr:hypothetical protein [Enterocloster aldenensis]